MEPGLGRHIQLRSRIYANHTLAYSRRPAFWNNDSDIRFKENIESKAGLKRFFPGTSERKLRLSLKKLVEYKAVAKVRLGSKDFYAITKGGKKLLAAYKKVRRFFKA